MKITDEYGTLKIDVQTESRGNSAYKVACDDITEVYYGELHAEVTFKDFHIRVKMNPDKDGNWKDISWAREKAFDVIREHLSEVFLALVKISHKMGRKAGIKEGQEKMRDALGLPPYRPWLVDGKPLD